MKLLIISSELPPGPGGIGTHAAALATQLTARGWDVTVLSRQDYAKDEEVAAYNAAQPFRVVRFREIPGSLIEAVYRYRVASRVIAKWKPDVILASGERSVWLASRLSRTRRTPWVAVGHGTEFGTRSTLERALHRRAFTAANIVVCPSEYTRSRMHAAGIRARREYVIPNGADHTVFHVQSVSAERRAPGPAVLLTVGQVTERKGQEVVIRALPLLPDVRYEMIGIPTRGRELTALAKELGVADRIQFVGRAPQEELVRRMNECDLFVMTSRNTSDGDFEGYGIAVVEAALCGKTSVVSAGSGLSEAIVAGETGLLARENDPKDTARAIAELLGDDVRRRRMANAARTRAIAEQTWEQRAARYDAVLREAMQPAGRRIVVISDTPHYRRGDIIVGWGSTVRELDELSALFDELIHVAPVYSTPAPANALPYMSRRISVRELKPSGGDMIADKLGVIARMPGYLRAAFEEMRGAQAIHLRCPASVSMMVALLLPALKVPTKRWIKYAGNWSPKGEEPWTYEVQRWWLSRPWHRAIVTVNGAWPNQPKHVKPFFNPSLTDAELIDGRRVTLKKKFDYPVRLLFVGRLEEAKGVRCVLDVFMRLRRMGLAVALDLIGDGPLRLELEGLAHGKGLGSTVRFHGWLPHAALPPHYAAAHLLLFPSLSEGWPKVLSEAMAFGVVPVASRISSIPEYLLKFRIGTVADPGAVNGFVNGVTMYINSPQRWQTESRLAQEASRVFSFTHYLDEVRLLLDLPKTGST